MDVDKEYILSLPIMDSPVPISLIITSYLLLVIKIGPDYMENRPAFKLTMLTRVYNMIQVVISITTMSYGINVMRQYGLFDEKCNWTENFTSLSFLAYLYFLSKIVDFVETILFVLRKKQNQVTFLHVYHHTAMVAMFWIGLKSQSYSYAITFMGTTNAFVHMIMYSYYALSTIPAMTKYLWWKKYLTGLQLVQFAIFLVYIPQYIKKSECGFPNFILGVLMSYIIVLAVLFGKFYIDSYIKKREDSKKHK